MEIVNRYYNGDCLEMLPQVPDNSIDLSILDPPYFIPAKHYSTRTNFRRNFGDLGILEGFFKTFFKQLERIMKNDGIFYMFCNGQSYPLFFYHSYFFTKSVRPIIWDKLVSINGYSWRHQHEIILFGEMMEAKPVKTGDGDIIKCRAVPVKKRIHPAQKPKELIRKLILKSSKEDQLVADFFAGSGVVLKMAKKLNRNYFGIEYEKSYYEIGKRKLENINKIENKSIKDYF